MALILRRRRGSISDACGCREFEGKFKENGIWLERIGRMEKEYKQTRKEV